MSGEMRSRVDWPAFAVQLKREFDERCAIAARSEWRLGRGNGLAIYAMRGYDRDEDIYVGQMLTPELAAAVVEQHNAAIHQGPELAPNQDAETPEPVLGSQKGPAPG